eukprot:1162065-Pelagomonas_calceolata.AAC.6
MHSQKRALSLAFILPFHPTNRLDGQWQLESLQTGSLSAGRTRTQEESGGDGPYLKVDTFDIVKGTPRQACKEGVLVQ